MDAGSRVGCRSLRGVAQALSARVGIPCKHGERPIVVDILSPSWPIRVMMGVGPRRRGPGGKQALSMRRNRGPHALDVRGSRLENLRRLAHSSLGLSRREAVHVHHGTVRQAGRFQARRVVRELSGAVLGGGDLEGRPLRNALLLHQSLERLLAQRGHGRISGKTDFVRFLLGADPDHEIAHLGRTSAAKRPPKTLRTVARAPPRLRNGPLRNKTRASGRGPGVGQ
mmetsp:Transcript_13969/g.52158  ORF Transcript_13969/g.52158 Transcript_13969/m.52158 type:complete len:226 (+) Transcript_13969:552-1229(+)